MAGKTSISSQLRSVRDTLDGLQAAHAPHRLPPPPLPHVPPPQHRPSVLAREAARWSPTGLALLISATVPLARIWNVNSEMKEALKQAKADIKTLNKKEAELRKALGSLNTRYSAFRSDQVDYRAFQDSAFCSLGVKPSYGCSDEVTINPKPLRGSKAPPIQPRVTIKRLLPEEPLPPEEPDLPDEDAEDE